MKEITVRELYQERRISLHLELLTGEDGLDRRVVMPDINRPGMALSGYLGYFLGERVQIIGITETGYLATLEPATRLEAVRRIAAFELPCIIVTKKLEVHEELLAAARERSIPVLRTDFDTTDFIHRLTSFLDNRLAPMTNIHGTLADVYGIGLLITGESGIGKSECALDLIERGHRLVADDVVTIKRKGEGILVGYGNNIAQHHMEIRGVGIIDLAALFGIRAVRMRKRVEVEIKLVRWQEGMDYERLGLTHQPTSILGVAIPSMSIPVVPGKNISVIVEVVAMNFLLNARGYKSAEEFDRRLKEAMQKKFDSPRFEEEEDTE
jgi:HPr kinase/phosphorylase